MLEFDRKYHQQLNDIGIPVIDLVAPTQAMLEASRDGVHYNKLTQQGRVVGVVGNLVFHELFEALTSR
jgi:hypothetical protein